MWCAPGCCGASSVGVREGSYAERPAALMVQQIVGASFIAMVHLGRYR